MLSQQPTCVLCMLPPLSRQSAQQHTAGGGCSTAGGCPLLMTPSVRWLFKI